MKRAIFALTCLVVLAIPVVALALQPPSGGGSGSVGRSPEPLTALLLIAGATPTYFVYRWRRRFAMPPESVPE